MKQIFFPRSSYLAQQIVNNNNLNLHSNCISWFNRQEAIKYRIILFHLNDHCVVLWLSKHFNFPKGPHLTLSEDWNTPVLPTCIFKLLLDFFYIDLKWINKKETSLPFQQWHQQNVFWSFFFVFLFSSYMVISFQLLALKCEV